MGQVDSKVTCRVGWGAGGEGVLSHDAMNCIVKKRFFITYIYKDTTTDSISVNQVKFG